ncbi:hypothetical protein like AT5G27870 [Hibiscus trionum]|uniref:Pectinesterase n=1 Tax=Hibiscus trionum TaxID=183268 RepID=A0A9W7IIS1_HIBTR|nr:hypothetical protein like AT5G27870 [Hibiscus trionum]
MANSVLFIIVLMVALVASALTAYFAIELVAAKKHREAREAQLSTSNKAIQSICQPTQFKEACEQSMSSANSTEPKDLIRAEFQATVEEIKKVVAHSKTLKELQNDEKTEQAFDVCHQMFDWAIQDLERSFGKLGEVDMSKIDEILLTLQVWLSAALTSQQTCIDSYEEMDGHAAEKMMSILTKSQELTRNGISILNGFSALTKDLDINNHEEPAEHRRLLSTEFPEWMSYSDRKLLHDADTATTTTTTTTTHHEETKEQREAAIAAELGDFKPDFIVAKDGSEKYDSVAKALAQVPKKNTKRIVILIKAGIYHERIGIPKSTDNIMLIGEGPTKTIITGNVSVEKTSPRPTTFYTATVSAAGMGFIAKDITFENTIGPEGHQAVALRVSGDMSAFYNCHFNGYQDTLYSHEGRHFYRDCVISGTIDFIFGSARAVFQNCHLVVRKPMGNQACIFIAQGKKTQESASGFVFQNCTFSGDKDYIPMKDKNKSYLNRPWRAFATVVIMQSQIDDIIQPEGYIPMDGDKGLETGYFVEFDNRGPGSNTELRAKWPSIKEIDQVEVKKFTPGPFLESENWVPSAEIPCIPDMIPGL